MINVALLPVAPPKESWTSTFDLEDKEETSQQKVGDGASSKVYNGSFNGMTVAVKQLKSYSPQFSTGLIKSYEPLFHLKHDNVVPVFGICPKVGYIVMEYCETVVHGHTLRTLGHLLLHYGNDLPQQLRIIVLFDVLEGLHINNTQMSSLSSSLKQLMTPGY